MEKLEPGERTLEYTLEGKWTYACGLIILFLG